MTRRRGCGAVSATRRSAEVARRGDGPHPPRAAAPSRGRPCTPAHAELPGGEPHLAVHARAVARFRRDGMWRRCVAGWRDSGAVLNVAYGEDDAGSCARPRWSGPVVRAIDACAPRVARGQGRPDRAGGNARRIGRTTDRMRARVEVLGESGRVRLAELTGLSRTWSRPACSTPPYRASRTDPPGVATLQGWRPRELHQERCGHVSAARTRFDARHGRGVR